MAQPDGLYHSLVKRQLLGAKKKDKVEGKEKAENE
jgi:hypothetical protein